MFYFNSIMLLKWDITKQINTYVTYLFSLIYDNKFLK